MKAELNTYLSKRKSLNIRIIAELKEFPRLEKLPNTEKKLEYNKYLEKSPSPIIMLLNIFVNIFLNISQKDKSNTLPRKEKLKNINTFQLKDKLFTILKPHLKLNLLLVKLLLDKHTPLDTPVDILEDIQLQLLEDIILDIQPLQQFQPIVLVKLLHTPLELQLLTQQILQLILLVKPWPILLVHQSLTPLQILLIPLVKLLHTPLEFQPPLDTLLVATQPEDIQVDIQLEVKLLHTPLTNMLAEAQELELEIMEDKLLHILLIIDSI